MLLAECLKTIKVKDIQEKGQIYEINTKTPLDEGFELLSTKRILSAPVYDEKEKKYIGFLDVRDLVAFAVFATKENQNIQTLQEILYHGAKIHSRTQDEITVSYLCRRTPFKPVSPDAPLEEICKLFASGAHRVPILNAEGKVESIISQSYFIKKIIDYCPTDELMHQTVFELKLGSTPVIAVNEKESTLKAFSILDETGRSGIAVVDEHGVITGNTSASDLRLYIQQHETLNQPIMQFLQKLRQLETTEPSPVFTCHHDDQLNSVIGKLIATRAHRLFVVDQNFHPSRVVSITDIIRAFLKHINQ